MPSLTVMFGPSGSGKSTYLAQHYPNAVVCSADHWFMRTGKYVWDACGMDRAHQECLRKFLLHLMLEDAPDLAVDNAFTHSMSAHAYLQAGAAMGFQVRPVVMVPRGGWDINTARLAWQRNQHGVQEHQVIRAAQNINHLLEHWPGYWPSPIKVPPTFGEVYNGLEATP